MVPMLLRDVLYLKAVLGEDFFFFFFGILPFLQKTNRNSNSPEKNREEKKSVEKRLFRSVFQT